MYQYQIRQRQEKIRRFYRQIALVAGLSLFIGYLYFMLTFDFVDFWEKLLN